MKKFKNQYLASICGKYLMFMIQNSIFIKFHKFISSKYTVAAQWNAYELVFT